MGIMTISGYSGFSNEFLFEEEDIALYTHEYAWKSIQQHMLNDEGISEFHKRPPENPTLRVHVLEPDQPLNIEGYEVLAFTGNPRGTGHELPDYIQRR